MAKSGFKIDIDLVAMILVIVGALNWGLVGLLSFNLVTVLLGWLPLLVNIVYVLVGVAGGWVLYKNFIAKK
jgi:uncharacterized membrane protein YuzA (DUF378 family)